MDFRRLSMNKGEFPCSLGQPGETVPLEGNQQSLQGHEWGKPLSSHQSQQVITKHLL